MNAIRSWLYVVAVLVIPCVARWPGHIKPGTVAVRMGDHKHVSSEQRKEGTTGVRAEPFPARHHQGDVST